MNNTNNCIKEKGIQPVNIEDYPAIKNHLDGYYFELNKRADRGDTLYNLRNCAYLKDFQKQKIIFQEMVQESSFILDNTGEFLCLDTARIITGENLELLLAVLNSTLFFFAMKSFYGGGGLGDSGIRMKHTFFERFPIPKICKEDLGIIINIVNNSIKTDFNKIDEILFKSVSLTKEEIGFIESQ
jgi:hypothetical protein